MNISGSFVGLDMKSLTGKIYPILAYIASVAACGSECEFHSVFLGSRELTGPIMIGNTASHYTNLENLARPGVGVVHTA